MATTYLPRSVAVLRHIDRLEQWLGTGADRATDAATDPVARELLPAPVPYYGMPVDQHPEVIELHKAIATGARRVNVLRALAAERAKLPAVDRFDLVDDDAERRMEKIREARADTGHIDHSPGGSPNPWTGAAAPAPVRTVEALNPDLQRYYARRAKRETARAARDVELGRVRELVSWAEVLYRAQRAADHVMPDDAGYCADDRDDCAMRVAETVAAKLLDGWKAPSVPVAAVTGTRLRFYAQNARQDVDRRRAADDPESPVMAKHRARWRAAGGSTVTSSGPLVLTREAATVRAVELCELLNVRAAGPPWLVVYAAIRARTCAELLPDGGIDAIARELGFPEGASARFRMAQSRGRRIIRARVSIYTPEAVCELLGVSLHTTRGALGFAADSVSDLPANFDASAQRGQRRFDGKRKRDQLHSGTRERPGHRTPNVRRVLIARGTLGADGLPARRFTVRRFDWSGMAPADVPAAAITVRYRAPESTEPPAWARTLSPGQRRVLTVMAALRDQRAAAIAPADRAVARFAVGLPPVNGADSPVNGALRPVGVSA